MASVMSTEGNKKAHLSSSCIDNNNDRKHVSVYLAHHISEHGFVVYKKPQNNKKNPKQNHKDTNHSIHSRCTHFQQNLE